MIVEVINHTQKRVPRKYLGLLFQRIERKLKSRSIGTGQWHLGIVVVFVDAPTSRRLNHKYRGKTYATDVLSFSGDQRELLGELVVCPEVIERQASEHNLAYREELGYMCIHGLLHLLGFDHERGGAEERRMFRLQDWLFEDLCAWYDTAKRI